MQAQEQARKLGPRSPTPTRSGTRPEPPPVCVLFPRPGIVLLSPTKVRLSSATPLPRCSPPSPAKLCGAGVPGTDLGAGRGGAVFIASSPPLPGSETLGQRLFRAFLLGPFWCLLQCTGSSLPMPGNLSPRHRSLSHPAALNG